MKVPSGMLRVAIESFFTAGSQLGKLPVEDVERLKYALEEALRWLKENPIEPTKEQCDHIFDMCPYNDAEDYENRLSTQWILTEWQRRMFLE